MLKPGVHVGSIAFAVGKLRSFDDQLSVTCFHIRAISIPKEVELHLSQVKVARIFYQKVWSEIYLITLSYAGRPIIKDILGRSLEEMAPFRDTMFSLEPPKRREANAQSNINTTQPQRAPQQVAQSPMTITQQSVYQISMTKHPISNGANGNGNRSEGGNGDLSGQKGRVSREILMRTC